MAIFLKFLKIPLLDLAALSFRRQVVKIRQKHKTNIVHNVVSTGICSLYYKLPAKKINTQESTFMIGSKCQEQISGYAPKSLIHFRTCQ
jgi:hypothetical protein